VWRSYLIQDIKLLEGVQRRATWLVHGIADLKYDDRLKRLGLDRLKNRRLRSDLIETYKIFNGNYSINRELFVDIYDMSLDDGKLFKRRFRLDVRKLSLVTE